MIATRALFAFAALAVTACSTAPADLARNVKDGDPAVVNRDCKLLGTASGRSVFGGSEETRMEGAMLDAKAKAAAMGATHVIFLKADANGMLNTGQATVRAYKC